MAELLVYGEISRFAFMASADGVADAIREAGPDGAITVRVHSPGGSPLEASAMRARLEQHAGPVTVIVDGLAASAAAMLLATAGATVKVVEDARVMIHNASAFVDGDAKKVRSVLASMEMIDRQTAEVFASRTGLPLQRVVEMMEAETWMDAATAVALGFASEVIAPAAEVRQRVDLLQFRVNPAAGNLEAAARMCEGDRAMAFSEDVRKRLQLPETATEAEIMAALDASLSATPAPAPAAAAVADVDTIVQRVVERLQPAAPATPPADPTADAVRAAHDIAVRATVDRFMADRKIAPKDRERSIAACGTTAEQLQAMTAYWTEQPPLVGDAINLQAPKPGDTLSQMGERMRRAAGLKPETIAQIIKEEQESRAS